jgi:hypothetical protein
LQLPGVGARPIIQDAFAKRRHRTNLHFEVNQTTIGKLAPHIEHRAFVGRKTTFHIREDVSPAIRVLTCRRSVRCLSRHFADNGVKKHDVFDPRNYFEDGTNRWMSTRLTS